MPNYNRAIARQNTNAFPAWRSAMTVADRLYYVSAGIPGNTPGLNEPLPTHFGASGLGGSGAGWDVISGYASGTLLEDVGGPFGSMVYATGGHTRLQNQILGLDLNADSPDFFWYQQPVYKTSQTGGAELYYNPTEQAALLAGPRGSAAVIPTSGESVDGWDRQFPVAFDGWIFPAKLVTGQLGDNAPHGLRYGHTCYVPPSITGTGDGALFGMPGPQGPFVQSYMPPAGTLSEWVDATAISSGIRRLPYYFKNTRTGVWSEHKWQPVYQIYGFTGQSAGLFRDLKRIYVSGDRGSGTAGWWHVDLTNGIAGHTVSTRTEPGTSVDPNRYSSGAWTDGHPDGRHLAYFASLAGPGHMVVQDFDNGTQATLNIGGALSIPNTEQIGMSYDARNNRILIVLHNGSGPYYFSVYLPANPLNAAGYGVSLRTPTLNDGAMASQWGESAHFYGKTQFIPRLGVCLVPYGRNRMLGFVPAP